MSSTATAVASGSQAQVRPYVENRAPELHEAWANNSLTVFDVQSGQYITDVEACTNRFKSVLAIYASKTKDVETKKFDLLACRSWDDVQDTASKAVEAYKEKEKGWRGFMNRVGRSFGRNSPAHQGWINALPCGDYTAVACGALTLIFGAAARMGEVRKKILDALDCIPEHLEIPESYMQLYQEDETLQRKAQELYMALLIAIEGMFDWLDHKAYKEVGKVLAMQGHYGAPIDQKLKEVQVRAEAFVKQVEVCLHRKVDEIHYLARVNYNQTSTLLDSAQTTETALEDIKENLGSLAEGQKEAQNSLYSMLEGLMKNSEWMKKQVEWQKTVIKTITATRDMAPTQSEPTITFSQFQALLSMAPPIQQIRSLPAPPQPTVAAQLTHPMITAQQLILLFSIPPEFAIQDVTNAFRAGSQLKPSEQSRAEWLMSSQKFQTWFTTGNSDVLCVDGMSEIVPVGPLSYFIALLSSQLSQLPNAVPLTFFCGAHARSIDGSGDPNFLLCSLIVQLLAHATIGRQIDLSFVNQETVSGIQQGDLNFLFQVFQRLLFSVPSSATIFILLDGVSWYENEARRGAIFYLVQTLLSITFNSAAGNGTGPTIKLLTTSPKMSLQIKHAFPKEKQLVMPTEALGQGSPFNGRQMAMQQQRLFGSQSTMSSSGTLGFRSPSPNMRSPSPNESFVQQSPNASFVVEDSPSGSFVQQSPNQSFVQQSPNANFVVEGSPNNPFVGQSPNSSFVQQNPNLSGSSSAFYNASLGSQNNSFYDASPQGTPTRMPARLMVQGQGQGQEQGWISRQASNQSLNQFNQGWSGGGPAG